MPAADGRIGRAFAAHRGTTGLVPYLTAGYPSLEATREMTMRLARLGALAVELGVPFSDPIADGPDIQRASEWAVRAGVGAAEVLDLVAALRRDTEVPVVVMTYANPVLAMGAATFAARARAAGVDGVLATDLPPDEADETWDALEAEGLDTITLVAPTTDLARLPVVLARCRGFVYCLSRTGVTGSGPGEAGRIDERIAAVRGRTALPVAVGFGISSGADARALRGVADAVVVGAAFARAIAANPESGVADRVERLAGELLAALR